MEEVLEHERQAEQKKVEEEEKKQKKHLEAMEKKRKADRRRQDQTPVPFKLREVPEVTVETIASMCTPMDLNAELLLHQVVQGIDKYSICHVCQGDGKDTDLGSTIEKKLPAAGCIEDMIGPDAVLGLEQIFNNPNLSNNDKVRKLMLFPGLKPRIKQQSVSAAMMGKSIFDLSFDLQAQVNEANSTVPGPISGESDVLHRAHSTSFATWLFLAGDEGAEIYDAKTASALEEAYSGGPGAILQIKSKSTEYIIDLTDMTETNIMTGEVVPVIRIPGGEEEGKAHSESAKKAARDARLMVLVRGNSEENEYDTDSEDEDGAHLEEDTASWLLDAGAGWDLLDQQAAIQAETAYQSRQATVDIDLVQLDIAGLFRLDLRTMTFLRLPKHDGPPIAVRRLGNDIDASKKPSARRMKSRVQGKPNAKYAQISANTRGRALKRRRQLLEKMTPGGGIGARIVPLSSEVKQHAHRCPVCRGTGKTSCWLTPRQSEACLKAHHRRADDSSFDCLVCYGDGEFCLSAACGRHFYCADCIRGSLEAMTNTGQFPPRCPACRAENRSTPERPLNAGLIDNMSVSFLQQRGVITLRFYNRFVTAVERAKEKLFLPEKSKKKPLEDFIGMEKDDIRGVWELKVGWWNVRDHPTSRLGCKVVTKLKQGARVTLMRHVKKDWCEISAPKELQGKYIRLRTSEKKPRSWAHLEEVVAASHAEAIELLSSETNASLACPGECGVELLISLKTYETLGMGEFWEKPDGSIGGIRLGKCPRCSSLVCIRCQGLCKDLGHMCPKAAKAKDDKESMDWMIRECKKCPGCGKFVQKTEGCDIMMCGTNAHGKVYVKLSHPNSIFFSFTNFHFYSFESTIVRTGAMLYGMVGVHIYSAGKT
jgi:hypothetical protein